MKIFAKTRSEILLMDPIINQMVSYDRPYVLEFTPFIEARTGKGEIEVLRTDLPGEAEDEGFLETLKECEGDHDMAMDSYISTFDPEPEKKPEPKGRSKPKAGN